ncbi:hypothetical protein GH808_03795 [Acetobacterium fimetarium]|uniref:Uncharacterized protein n=1 Tax=Acetobacterium fimetarium TaxID=52691 RepID=A0ABR6WSJ5_9FIRM|nr:hypothetical protein [Acetobacterium fimetarium]MBC3803559.1 hypothetical protein [Acetobacterium fimetarium]
MAKKYSVRTNNTILAKMANNKLDYYLRTHNGDELYLFTREYSTDCYEMCMSGAPINAVLYGRKKDTAFMNLSKYLNFMMPYFVEYYELATA